MFEVTLDFELSNGSTIDLAIPASGTAAFEYYGLGDQVPTTGTLTNGDSDVLSIKANDENEAPATLSLKVLSIINQLSSSGIDLDSILGSGGKFYAVIEGLPISSGAVEGSSINSIVSEFNMLTDPT